MNNPQEFYKTQIDVHTHSLKKAKKQLLFSSIIRLFIFIGMIAGMYFGYPNTQIILASIILGIVLFIVLVNRHSNLSYE